MPNSLADASSPYLQQHKDNPVDWYSWGPQPLDRSHRENKPIFLSIGYSSCHWCHVMERESFSDPEVAKVLNENFVSIKVDREERPDLDHIYMQAVQMMTGSGGWPLNVFLTPDLRPFFGGTYFAPDARYGRPPFRELLMRVAAIYRDQPDEVKKNADQLTALILQNGRYFQASKASGTELIERVAQNLTKNLNRDRGGLGGAPKFFYVEGLRLLLRRAHRQGDLPLLNDVQKTLTLMAQGGVFDQVGGGFHRYSTDEDWKIPHFEKMLYDNALLMGLYAEASRLLSSEFFGNVSERIGEWILTEMRRDDGLFYSAMDADTEHEEGLFYTWGWEELEQSFDGETLQILKDVLEISPDGNFEGRNIFYFRAGVSPSDRSLALDALKTLYAKRARRAWPLLDKKVLTSWNALAISSFAKAGLVLGRADFVAFAERAAEALWQTQWRDAHMRHAQFETQRAQEYFLEDAAFLGVAFLDLAEVTNNQDFVARARDLGLSVLEDFYDADAGGFWSTPLQQTDLLCRFKEIHDGAIPSAYTAAISLCRRLFAKTADLKFSQAAERSIGLMAGNVLDSPGGFNSLAVCLDEDLGSQNACTTEACALESAV